MPLPPMTEPVNLVTQTILTYVSWGVALGLLLITRLRYGLRETWFSSLVLIAAGFAALAEPLYDTEFKLLFFIPGQWTLFTYLDIPQPLWTVSGYIVLYGGPAIFICRKLAHGMTQTAFLSWAAATFVISSMFEIYGIAGGTYAYWGPFSLRIFGYPVVVGALETAFVMLFSVLAYSLRRRVGDTGTSLALFLLFPFTFYGVNLGLGAPALVMLGVHAAPLAIVVAECLSIGLAVGTVVVLSSIVEAPAPGPANQKSLVSSADACDVAAG